MEETPTPVAAAEDVKEVEKPVEKEEEKAAEEAEGVEEEAGKNEVIVCDEEEGDYLEEDFENSGGKKEEDK